MPRDGSGNYTRPAGQPVTTGTVIDASVFNTLTADLATALTGSMPRDGQAPPTANLPMGGFKLTGLANGSAAADSITYGQAQSLDSAVAATAQSGSAQWLTSVSGTNTITGNASPAIAAYAAGQTFRFVPANTNTGATTLQINGVGSAQNVFAFGAACVGGELVAGVPVTVVHDGTRFQIIGAFSPRLNFQHTAFLLVSSTTTNLSDATYTRINLIEQLDPGNNIPASNYYVAPANGNYFVFGSVAIGITNAIATTTQVAYERANNAGANIGTGIMSASIMTVSSTPQVSGSSIVYMNAGDRLYLNGYQNNGGIRVAQAGNTCFLGGWRLT